jgi:hypothetical protein
MKKILLIILAVILLLTGCGKIEKHEIRDKIIRNIELKSKNTDECIISIKEITDFKWDKLVMFNEGASRQEINSVLGFRYEGETDLTVLTIFLFKGKIVYQENEAYDPEKPSKLFVQYPDSQIHHMEFSFDKAVFKGTKEQIDGEYYYKIAPIK